MVFDLIGLNDFMILKTAFSTKTNSMYHLTNEGELVIIDGKLNLIIHRVSS